MMTDRTRLSIRSRPISIGPNSLTAHLPEGLCSPPDLNLTPPGIVTKLDAFHRPKINWRMTGERLLCLCCSKKNQCFCKKCTLEKLKFYSRKENISIRSTRKAELEKEVDSMLGETSNLCADINTTTANITLLRKWVDEKKQMNKMKANRLAALEQLIASTARHANKVLSYYDKHDANELTMQKRREYKEAKVSEMNRNVFLLRKSLCGCLFSIFPVSEVIAQSVRPAHTTIRADENNGKWTMVGGHQVEEGPMVKVRDNFLSDGARERLGAALSDSLLNLTTELRSPFAAFLLSLQLVNNMATIFDFRLPYLLSYRDVSLRERWSRELLDNDWFKFCQSVLSLGLQLGMPPESLHFNYPHANIIEQARFVLEGAVAPKPHPVILASSHRFEINESLPRLNVDDRELISEWDTCEDLDM
uniref:Beclin 1-associated autophagy-related key regulator n=1 Tax=Haemonchus contortus TaxID=6289 RepID=A0A7I4Y0P6_HAECO|nr:Protein EPG-8, isoform a [Haemonchus contortus]